MNSIRTLLTVLALVASTACGAEDTATFDCGSHGGSCRTADQACVLNEGCSTCVDLPAACTSTSSCDCHFDASGMSTWGDVGCKKADMKTCGEASGGGLTIECPSSTWGCG